MNTTKKSTNKPKVMVAISGGMDSAVTTVLLHTQGYQVIGCYLQVCEHKKGESVGGCSLKRLEIAKSVCKKIGIHLQVERADHIFREKVIDNFIHERVKQRKAVPCIQCNKHVRLEYLYEKALDSGCDYIATGHYARIFQDVNTGKPRLLKGVDTAADQSYLLFGINAEILQKTLMPLGGLTMNIVEKMAKEFELEFLREEKNRENCFIKEDNLPTFFEKAVPPYLRPKGTVKTIAGELVSSHDGSFNFIFGQKIVADITSFIEEDVFVIGFEEKGGTVVVGPEEYLYCKEVIASSSNWIKPLGKIKTIKCTAKLSEKTNEVPCKLAIFENDTIIVEFLEKQKALAPGQAIVFYNEEEILGGAWIDKTNILLHWEETSGAIILKKSLIGRS